MAETYTSRTLRELLQIVASRFLGMVAILVIIVGAVVAASLYMPKQYRSEVQLMATPSSLTSPLEGTGKNIFPYTVLLEHIEARGGDAFGFLA